MSEPLATPSYGELAALVAEQAAQLAEQAVLIEALRVELEALRRQLGRDSSNSSQPPSSDGPGAKAKAKAGRRSAGQQGEQSPQRQPSAGAAGAAGRAAAEAGWAAGASRERSGPGGHPRPPGAGRAVGLPGLRWRVGRRAGNGRVLGAGVRPARLLGGGDRVSDDAPPLWLRAGHHRRPTGGGAGRADLLRPERDRRGDPAGQPGRARDRTHRRCDVHAAWGGGVHRVHLLLPDPAGRRADHGRVRGDAQGGAARTGRVGHRRNPRPADRRHHRCRRSSSNRSRRRCYHDRWQRVGLPQPARVHRAHDARLHRRRAGPGLVRRGR